MALAGVACPGVRQRAHRHKQDFVLRKAEMTRMDEQIIKTAAWSDDADVRLNQPDNQRDKGLNHNHHVQYQKTAAVPKIRLVKSAFTRRARVNYA